MDEKSQFVFQLQATGESLMGFLGRKRTNTVFTSREAAERRIPAFRDMLVDSAKSWAMVDDESLKIEVVPLEIVEEP